MGPLWLGRSLGSTEILIALLRRKTFRPALLPYSSLKRKVVARAVFNGRTKSLGTRGGRPTNGGWARDDPRQLRRTRFPSLTNPRSLLELLVSRRDSGDRDTRVGFLLRSDVEPGRLDREARGARPLPAHPQALPAPVKTVARQGAPAMASPPRRAAHVVQAPRPRERRPRRSWRIRRWHRRGRMSRLEAWAGARRSRFFTSPLFDSSSPVQRPRGRTSVGRQRSRSCAGPSRHVSATTFSRYALYSAYPRLAGTCRR